MPPGAISSLASSLGPSSTSAAGSADWFEIVTFTRPAPTALALLGLTLTLVSLISAVSSIGEAGRGLFSKSSSPQAASAKAATSAATGTMSLLRPPIPRATLAEANAPERRFGESQKGSSTISASSPSPTATVAPGLRLAADDRERDRAEGGGDDRGADVPDLALAARIGSPPAAGAERRRPRRWRLGLPL